MIHYENMTKEQVISILKDTEEYIGEVHKDYDVQKEEIERLKTLWEADKQSWNELMAEKETEIERLNNIINEIEEDIKNLYTYGIKNNAEQRDYLLNRLQELKGSDKNV